MSRMLFVNLAVENVAASRAFFDTLGFTFNDMFCDENTACLEINEQTYVMLLEKPRFRDFINDDICDTTKAREALMCVSADSREGVDALVDGAIAAGGSEWVTTGAQKAQEEMGDYAYQRAFRDLDNHVWEVMWMDMAAAQQADATEAAPAEA
ncbi:glyoxalase [Rhodococcus pyridinivorans SB3094]|uniref:Glyoxalase n=1 Tax=Rhodococcus pyridinivorans SB3094 TaxID=1435356 RepID=V9XH52_9NOCA|nr:MULTISPECIES: glyoxalase [Rhodococcus]AHD21329.1 glyoxalase [Rhodococcus pyridinivorans SB3094]MCT7291190.1 glyoxalase [Rhodococcus sp. PAE-6]